MRPAFNLLILLSILIFASACSMTPNKYDAKSFGKNKRFALVSINSTEEINVVTADNSRTLAGLVKQAGSESGMSHPANKILAKTSTMLEKSLRKTGHFKLLPRGKVLNNKYYKKTKGDEPKVFMSTLLLAKDYKYFKKEADLAKLAQQLNVDAVVSATLIYTAPYGGASLFGMVGAGSHHGQTQLVIYAVDRTGKVIWHASTTAASEKSLGSGSEAVNFKDLHPLLEDATQKAIQDMLKTLDTKLKGA